MKKLIGAVLACGLFALTLALPTAAATYKGYTYNYWEEAVPSQLGYEPTAVYTGAQLSKELGDFRNPKDLYITADREIYILDSGNGRVVILDESLKLKKVIDTFTYQSEQVELDDPNGIFVDKNKDIYITDPGNAQVLVSDQNGLVRLKLGKPDTNMLDENLEFKPQRVLVDSAGVIYVTASGVYQGALLYKQDGSFDGFYGSNTVEVSASLMLDRFWKQILSDEQVDTISKYVPEEFTSFDIDERDFVYTVTQTATVLQKVKKLNPMGSNILTATDFGELEELYVNHELSSSRFVDIAITKDDNFVVLDQQNNRIFEYDREGEPLFIFGGTGQQAGTFALPAALDVLEDRIFVVDTQKSNLTVFDPTAFGERVLSAVDLYNAGRYSEATTLWQEILKSDHNFNVAYISIGKSLMAEEKFKEAAEYFELGNDREGNSEAFQSYRNELMQKHFPVICIVIVAVLALIIYLVNRKEKKKEEKKPRRKTNPFKLLLHPIDQAEEMKRRKSGSWLYSFVILAIWFISSVMSFALTGFRFNENNIDNMNIGLLFLGTLPVFTVFVGVNWGVCTLMDGKGKMKDIWISSSYCLIPYVVCSFVYIGLSWVLVLTEAVFLQWILLLGIIWSVCMLLGVLAGIHEYSFGQTIASVLLTIVGMLIAAFLILLAASLLQQAYSFVVSMVNELLYRMR